MGRVFRNLLQSRYEECGAVIERIRQRWETLPVEAACRLQDWKQQGRP